ncbi:MAG TPA: ATP-binding protein, partial [Candidatus Atribacteria bacterium]|nr:ATP-binding protein [Candidatus Atribacteria bacterium]
TVERFSRYFSIARLIFFVPKFSFSLKEQILNPKKVYCIDPGLRNIISFKFMEDFGRIAENIVFLNLLFRNKKVYYWKDYSGKEVDFVLKEKLRVKQLIQVCWNLSSEKTKEREIKGLLKAMKEFKLNEGMIITEDYEGEEEFKGKKIIYTPLWKWLLTKENISETQR